MYCWNCGREIGENISFCPDCGTKIENDNVNIVNESKLEDDFTVTAWHISGRTILKIIALIMVIACLCPMFRISNAGQVVVDFSLLDIANGRKSTDGGSLWGMWLYLLYPLSMLICLFNKEGRAKHGESCAEVGGCCGLILIMLHISACIYIKIQEYSISLYGLFPYYLYLAGTIASVIIGFRLDYLQRQIDNRDNNQGKLTEKEMKNESILVIAKDIAIGVFSFFFIYIILLWIQS
jgi:hypothetical protein